MIDVILTSYNEPKATCKALKAILEQSSRKDLQVLVVDPFPETEVFLKSQVKDSRWSFFLDPGEGKGFALNMLFQERASSNPADIFIMTDGDVFLDKGALEAIISCFKDKRVGCVAGHPVPLESRKTMYGYWAHLFMDGIDRVRESFSKRKVFFECSGYLFSIRKGILLDFPTETSEDSVIPYLIWKKGHQIAYAQQALVYVKNPENWADWIAQKVRNIKAHERLKEIAPDMPRTKSFLNEVKLGTLFALKYPKNVRELWWTLCSFGARLYIYKKAFSEIKKGRKYSDGWRGQALTHSTNPLSEHS